RSRDRAGRPSGAPAIPREPCRRALRRAGRAAGYAIAPEATAQTERLLWADCVEKRLDFRGIIWCHDSWGAVDDGGTASPAGRVFLRVFARTACARAAPVAVYRPVCRTRWGEARAGGVLQRHWPTIGRSRAHDPHADRRLLLRDSLGAPAVRGGSSEPRLSVVL